MSQRSSNNWFLSPSMRTTSITESVEHEDDDDDDISDFSSQNTNVQDDGRHSDIQSFGDQSQDEEDQQNHNVRNDVDGIHEANTINNEKAQVSDNDDLKKRGDLVSAAITNVLDSCTDHEADTLPYNPEESLENDLEVDTLPYDPQECLSNDSDADTIPYDPEEILLDDLNNVYEADTAQYNSCDSLPPSPVDDDLSQASAAAMSPQKPTLPSESYKENDDNQSNADSVNFFEDSQFIVFSPTEQPQYQEIRSNDNHISTIDELDEFDPDISDDELPGSPLFIEHQQESVQLFSIPAVDNPLQVPNTTHLSPSNGSSSSPRKEQSQNLLSSRNSKQCSIHEESDSFMDGMVSSLSTYKSLPSVSQEQRQQQCSPPSQKQSSLLGYSRVVKSQSVLPPSQSSPETKNLSSQHVISPTKKNDANNSQKTQRARELSQSSNSNIATHKYTLSSYYPIKKEETRVDSKLSYTPKKHNSSTQCTDPETSTTSPPQHSQSIDNNNTKNKSFQTSILHQTTLPKYSSFSQTQSDHDEATLSSPKSSLRKPSIGLSRKHVISSPSKSSERDTKKHRPKLSDIFVGFRLQDLKFYFEDVVIVLTILNPL
ncbi:hypothetical protein INT45_004463 [Circinella minor]|uniref:Uncharacterized protein n=1 Tax=Circinella minor TaxID=1195481 RepID=A0A8H7VNH5_9FUNG|nr:hypothetical protein INT45_004463 [Circinella minor]